MNTKIRKQIERRKQRLTRRLDRDDLCGCHRPIMTASNIHYEIADRTRATPHGGIGAIHLLTKQLGLDQAINQRLGLLKLHLPYHDSDHVLNLAYNLLAAPADRVPPETIAAMTERAEVPEPLRQEIDDPAYGAKKPLFRRTSNKVTVTLFDGGHELVASAAAAWFDAHVPAGVRA